MISLLSSPEPEPLPKSNEPPKPPSSSLRGSQQCWDWSGAGAVGSGEPIPESSAPTRQVSGAQTGHNDLFFDSDDFDITGDLGGGASAQEGQVMEDRPSKRRRVSRDSLDLPTLEPPHKRAASTVGRAPIPSPSPVKTKPKVAIEPIELSSSPIRPSGGPSRTLKPTEDNNLPSPRLQPRPLTTKTTSAPAGDISDFSNPFASSSPPPPNINSDRADPVEPSGWTGNASEQQQACGSGANNADSSKVSTVVALGFTELQARKALHETNSDVARAIHWLVEHSEAKDDSGTAGRREPPARQAPPEPKPRASPKKPVAWDPISSSAPYSYAVRSSPPRSRTLQRSRSEIICLDDSDDAASKPTRRSHSRAFALDDSGSELDFESPAPKDKSEPFKFDDSDLNSDMDTEPKQISQSRALTRFRPVSKPKTEAFKLDDLDSDGLGLSSSDSDGPDHLAVLRAEKRRTSGRKSTTASRTGSGSKSRTNTTKKTPEELAGEKITRESDKLRAKQAREAEKERKAKEKQLAKEEKAAEKIRAAALAEVNKKRTDKKVSTPEMIVDIPEGFDKKKHGDVEVMLKDIDVEYHFYPSPVDNVVKWRRKVRARYNQTLGHWEPIPLRIGEEKHAMAIVEASHLVDLILATDDDAESKSLEQHVTKIKSNFKDHKLIYLIQGLSAWMSANRNFLNRQFHAAVNNLDAASSTPAVASSRRKKAAAEPIRRHVDDQVIEEALLRLQVHHQVLIHHTKTAAETASQIAIFTQQLSTLPYRRLRDDLNAAAASFCMESGQVKTGDGTRDTYARMLQEINRITAPIAYGIMGEFESVGDLVRGMESGGPLRLEDVRKCVDREGNVGDDARRIGPSVSKRVWGIFTGRNEGSMNV